MLLIINKLVYNVSMKKKSTKIILVFVVGAMILSLMIMALAPIF